MTRRPWWILVAALILAPSTAQAQIWWDFIESLSGPGPWKGGGVFWRLGCFTPNEFRLTCWDDTDPTIRQLAEVRWLKAETVDDRPVLIVDPSDRRKVSLDKVDAVVALRLTPHLDIGAGGGFMRFALDDYEEPNKRITVTRATIIPVSVTFTPLAPFTAPAMRGIDREQWRRFLRLRMEVTYIPFGFTPEDWDRSENVSETQYSTDGNWVLAGGLLFDLRGLFTNLRLFR
jgi:hypothetical protein